MLQTAETEPIRTSRRGILPQGQIAPEDETRVIARIAKDHHLESEEAGRIFAATRNFLALAAAFPGRHFVPSNSVDKGWHTFLLYTKTYTDFCESLGVSFLHHEPSDGRESAEVGGAARTVEFMQREGIEFDAEAWAGPHKAGNCDCSGCEGRD